MTSTAVLGAGSWGTALALQIARAGTPVTLWGRDPDQVRSMAARRENARYLPGVGFPDILAVESDLAAVAQRAELLLLVTPSHAIPGLLVELGPLIGAQTRIAWAAKGFEPGSGRFLHEVVEDLIGADRPGAVVTGPSFAQEVAAGLPTAVTVASTHLGFARQVASVLHHGNFRTYTSDDIVGAELGGAVKNVLAVGTGIADGMGLGANARAALITRGLAEMMRLADALGGRRETLMGLSGVGDLVLTSTGDLSRNRRFGLALGQGEEIARAEREIGQVVEGIKTAEEVVRLGRQHRLELPISEVVCRIVQGELTPADGLRSLMAREPKRED